MELTPYHAKYFAYELTKRCSSDSIEKLAGAVASAQVDLNPHQVDAALFAFNSPLSKGALLADEVGLGKTIEAGLILSQRWAERKRRILVIVPSNLRKHWHQELTQKFFLPCRILETKAYTQAIRQSKFRLLVVCSAFRGCKDDYSLKMENLPKAPPPKGQMELIAADGDGATQSGSIDELNLRNEVG